MASVTAIRRSAAVVLCVWVISGAAGVLSGRADAAALNYHFQAGEVLEYRLIVDYGLVSEEVGRAHTHLEGRLRLSVKQVTADGMVTLLATCAGEGEVVLGGETFSKLESKPPFQMTLSVRPDGCVLPRADDAGHRKPLLDPAADAFDAGVQLASRLAGDYLLFGLCLPHYQPQTGDEWVGAWLDEVWLYPGDEEVLSLRAHPVTYKLVGTVPGEGNPYLSISATLPMVARGEEHLGIPVSFTFDALSGRLMQVEARVTGYGPEKTDLMYSVHLEKTTRSAAPPPPPAR